MKISSGWSKGLKILTPEGLGTRPTRERVRQSALNMLQPWIADARVLDLFAGSGAVGLELVSRGASGVIFVEQSPHALKALKSNTQAFWQRAASQAIKITPWDVRASDVDIFLQQPNPNSFDIVWADPPYEAVAGCLNLWAEKIPDLVTSGGVFTLESSTQTVPLLEEWDRTFRLRLTKRRSYGISTISIWQKS